MIHSHRFTLDQFAPISVYEKLKKLFPDEISFLLESAGNSDGNYTIIALGARERLRYEQSLTLYTNVSSRDYRL